MYCFGQVAGSDDNEGRMRREQRLRQSPARHAALAQLHRWCQWRDEALRGRPAPVDLFDRSACTGTTIHPEGPFHLCLPRVRGPESGVISIDATLEQFGAAPRPGERLPRSISTCSATLRQGDGTLPKILALTLGRGEADRVDPIAPEDPAHRVRSLVHYFTALVEDPRRDAKPFAELLADPFRLDYLDPPLDTLDALASWVAGPLSSVLASSHSISDLRVHATGPDEYTASMTMASEALFPDGSGFYSRNTQRWIVIDDARERFPRIRHIAITREPSRRFQA